MDDAALGLATSIRTRAEKPAFVEGDRVLTYGELGTRVRRAARWLASRGVGPGDRVAIMLPNSIAFFEVWAAAGECGAAVVLVNVHLKRDEVDYILRDSQAKVLVDDVDEYERAVAAIGDEELRDVAPVTGE